MDTPKTRRRILGEGVLIGCLAVLALPTIIALISVAFPSLYLASPDSAPSQPASPGRAAPIDATSEEIFAAYDANEIGADNAYKAKIIRMHGRVSGIGRDSWGIRVGVESPRWFRLIYFYFPESQAGAVGALREHDSIIVAGKFERYGSGIALRECVIEGRESVNGK